MTTKFGVNFLEDNFLSEDDWVSQEQFASFAGDETIIDNQGSESMESPISDWTMGSSSTHSPNDFVQNDDQTNLMLDFGLNDLVDGYDSPPLNPSDDKIEISFDDMLNEAGTETFEETKMNQCDILMDSFASSSTRANMPAKISDVRSVNARIRSSSDASSSTSAYSSQSATPPPSSKALTDDIENAFFDAPPSSAQSTVQIQDEGFHDTLAPFTLSQPVSNRVCKSRSASRRLPRTSKPKKSLAKQGSPIIISDEESDFDRQVREALKETNRLLNMHKVHSNEPDKAVDSSSNLNASSSHPQDNKAALDLRRLCDNTILENTSPSQSYFKGSKPVETPLVSKPITSTVLGDKSVQSKKCPDVERIIKELKRKASEKYKAQSKQPFIPQSTVALSIGNPVKTVHLTTAAPPSAQTNISQTCHIPIASQFKLPVTCNATNYQPPMKIIVKQETTPNLYIAASDPNNSIPLTVIRTDSNTPISSCSQQVLSATTAVCQVKDEIPLSTIVIKPDQPTTAIPISSLNITTSQPAIKVIQNCTTPISQPKKYIAFMNQSSQENTNETKLACSKVSTKPLMVSQPAKKIIVPNGNTAYPPVVVQNGVGITSPRGILGNMEKNTTDSIVLTDMDSRVMKRQQRMIKNREAACQSRQRRKEYISMLEQQMNECLEDNNKLRALNTQLKHRISELEQENAALRSVAVSSTSRHKKAACILMLVMFIGFNLGPLRLLSGSGLPGDASIVDLNSVENNSNGKTKNWPVPVETSYHARQLLSLEEQAAEKDKLKVESSQNEVDKEVSLPKVQDGQTFWMDDMVEDYKRKHLTRIFEILQDTSSVSLQRLLRRKLKEELGIRVPLPVPRSRRIAYTPSRLSHNRRGFAGNSIPNQRARSGGARVKVPSPSPNINTGGSTRNKGSGLSPCELPNEQARQPNETETLRISDNIAKWIKQHEVQQRKSIKINPETSTRGGNSKRKRKSSRAAPKRAQNKNSVPAVYERRGRMKKILEAINRKNDTAYMISFSKDHILLPAVMLNVTERTKLSLVLPTLPPNDSFADENYQTMIQINCEVFSTDYLKIDRDLLPDDKYPTRNHGEEFKPKGPYRGGNPKHQAFHGSKQTSTKRHLANNNGHLETSYPPDDDVIVADDMDL